MSEPKNSLRDGYGFGRAAVLLGALLCLGCDDPGAESTGPGPSTGGCPEDGGAMSRLPSGFCIDRTEVTRGAYFSWLESEPATDAQPAQCGANDTYFPTCLTTGGWGLDRYLDNPVGCVDWCDASSFCEAHGKRLCGRIGGGASPMDAYDDAAQNEWFAACSSGGVNDYVFGEEYVARACYESLESTWGTAEATSFGACESPDPDYAGVYDLGGNVAEWENACDGDGAEARCRIRGGSFKHQANGIRCDAGETLSFPRSASDDAVGFRCCAD